MSYKKHLAAIAGHTPACELFEMWKHMPRILFYHGVIGEPYCDQRVQANQIPQKEFERHINYLLQHYHFISVDEFYERFIQHDKFTGKELILTFDDGYKNNLTIAAPLLEKRRIPFTVFVSTNLVDTESFVPTYYVRSAVLSQFLTNVEITTMKRNYQLTSDKVRMEAVDEIIHFIKTKSDQEVRSVIEEIENQLGNTNRMELNSHYESERIMSWKDAQTLTGMGATIGSHSEDHSILHNQQSTEDLEGQLKNSRDKIIKHIGECKYFAFPNGDSASVCDRSRKMVSKFYDMGFAVTGKSVSFTDDKTFVSRIGVAFDLYMLRTQLSLLA